jgi:hypothetical protein
VAFSRDITPKPGVIHVNFTGDVVVESSFTGIGATNLSFMLQK